MQKGVGRNKSFINNERWLTINWPINLTTNFSTNSSFHNENFKRAWKSTLKHPVSRICIESVLAYLVSPYPVPTMYVHHHVCSGLNRYLNPPVVPIVDTFRGDNLPFSLVSPFPFPIPNPTPPVYFPLSFKWSFVRSDSFFATVAPLWNLLMEFIRRFCPSDPRGYISYEMPYACCNVSAIVKTNPPCTVLFVAVNTICHRIAVYFFLLDIFV